MKNYYKKQVTLGFAILLMMLGFVMPADLFADERDADEAAQAALGHSPDEEEAPRPARMVDLTKGEPLPPPAKGKPITWNMGPSGIIGIKNGGNEGDQVQVISIVPGAPAEGIVLPGDVLLGIGGTDFVVGGDINFIAGNAIIKAEEEAGKGLLNIHIWRDRNWVKRAAPKDVFGVDVDQLFKEAEVGGDDVYEWKDEEEKTASVKQMGFDKFPIDGFKTNLTVQLRVIGTYSETSPWDCPVVAKVREDAWAVLAAGFKPDKSGRIRGDWPGALALVASGKPEYRELVRNWVHTLKLETNMTARISLDQMKSRGMRSWATGFEALEQAIYYDATGDDYVLPEIRRRAIWAALGQSGGGSWGHTFAFPSFNGGKLHGINPGYGGMNNAGTRCFFMLTLAKKFGIDDPEINAAIVRANRFFGTYIDKGCIPYGDHAPWPSDDSNGKNYGAAYAFYVLGRKYEAKYFSMCSAHAAFTRRGGHGSATLWYYTPWSANIAGPRAVQASMRNMRQFYTLSRRHDGSFVFLGEQSGIGGKGMRNPTATVAMHLSAPLKQLIITGKDADENFWMTDEELNELLVSARAQIKDPVLLDKIGKPFNERNTDELIDMLDHFFPNMRRAIAGELGKRCDGGEKDIVAKLLPLLASEEARMRDGACLALSACGAESVLANMSKIVAMLKDDAEFVRMTAANTIGKATEVGDPKREVELLAAAAEDYAGMTMDHGNVRNAVKGVIFAKKKKGAVGQESMLLTSPFRAGYDEELVRTALEKIVTMDPQGTIPGTWDKEALLKLAGPITFAAAERQINDAMFGGSRKSQAQELLRKFGYREAIEGDAFNLLQRSVLPRGHRRGVGYKDGFITPKLVKKAPGSYRFLLDSLRLWQQDEPVRVLSEGNGKGQPTTITELDELIEWIEKAPAADPLPGIGPEVEKMFESELAAAGDAAAQIKLCRKELEKPERKNYFRKMAAMTKLAQTLGVEAIGDVSPFLGHEHWRLREHAGRAAVDLVKQGAGQRLVELFGEAQARESGLLGNWNAAGILAALVDAQYKPALSTARAALKHSDPVVRGAAVRAVFTIGGDPEFKTVFEFMGKAEEPEDFEGCELALLSRRDDPEHVKRVSEQARSLLSSAGKPELRRSLAWLLGQFGGSENLAAIQKAAATPVNDSDLKELVLALAYSPDGASSQVMLALAGIDDTHRDVVAGLSVHRMVGRNGTADVTDQDRVGFAKGVLNLKYNKDLIAYLGKVHTGAAVQLLFDVMQKGRESTANAVKGIISCVEGMNMPMPDDAKTAAEVMTQVIEYIEVTQLRGGAAAHMGDKGAMMAYAEWQTLQARAGKALLKVHKPKKAAIPEFDDKDLDL